LDAVSDILEITVIFCLHCDPEPSRLASLACARDAMHTLPYSMPECDRAFVNRLRARVLEGLSDPALDVPLLARHVALSSRQLQRRCRELTGCGPLEFIRRVRLDEARAMVSRGSCRKVAEIAVAVGMSPSSFTRRYAAWFGRVPSDDIRRRPSRRPPVSGTSGAVSDTGFNPRANARGCVVY
jgi:AraC-like DNA-binding protein